MGVVWRAEDTLLGREVALKEVTFPPGISEQERDQLRERTRREARAAARLSHPSAVTMFDVTEDDGTPILVMELIDARTLAEVVEADGPLSPQRTAEVGLAVLGALEAAHEQGIVHRDVKPSNVLLADDGRVVLTDFGIATFTGDSSLTSTGLLVGSPSYIAPERARGDKPGPACDLWSLGATLFTAVEGRPPFGQREPIPTLAAVMTEEHAPFEAAGPLAPLLDGLLVKDQDRRYDAGQARAALEKVVATEAAAPARTVPLTVPIDARSARTQVLDLGAVAHQVEAVPYPEGHELLPAPAAPTRHRRRFPTLAVTTALALLALVVGAAVLLIPDRSPRSADPKDAARGPSGAPTAQINQPAGAALPDGWARQRHDSWSVAVPTSYQAGTFAGFPQYKDPTSGRTLRVSATPPGGGKDDAVQDRRDQAQAFRASHSDYQEIAITKASYRGLEAADWEFTYTSGGTKLHVINRVFVEDGRGYSLYFQTRASDDWPDARAEFDQIAAQFRS
jgi:hypothetical protein